MIPTCHAYRSNYWKAHGPVLLARRQRRTDKIDCWRNSEQKHRWLATAVLEIEPRLRRVRGHRHLPRLRAALQSMLKIRRTEAA